MQPKQLRDSRAAGRLAPAGVTYGEQSRHVSSADPQSSQGPALLATLNGAATSREVVKMQKSYFSPEEVLVAPETEVAWTTIIVSFCLGCAPPGPLATCPPSRCCCCSTAVTP